jgi:hypothetical protein
MAAILVIEGCHARLRYRLVISWYLVEEDLKHSSIWTAVPGSVHSEICLDRQRPKVYVYNDLVLRSLAV